MSSVGSSLVSASQIALSSKPNDPDAPTASGLDQAANVVGAPPAQPLFPLLETAAEKARIDAFLAELDAKLALARQRRAEIVDGWAKTTRMLVPDGHNFFSKLFPEEVLFDLVKLHHHRAVLLVADRFGWEPSEVLALWQTEGLPSSSVHTYEGAQPRAEDWQDISAWYEGTHPTSPRQARAWARSAVLWERWGLDRLTPHIREPGEENRLRVKNASGGLLPAAAHDAAFSRGFVSEVGNFLPSMPLDYLNSVPGPIQIRARAGGGFEFRTLAQYQATVLALQQGRYKNQITRIPERLDFDAVVVDPRPVAPAVLYMHYNSRFGAEQHLTDLAARLVAWEHSQGNEATSFDGRRLMSFWLEQPIPEAIVDYVLEYAAAHAGFLNGHSYVNALRFEYARQIYEVLYEGFMPLPSIYEVDE